MRRNPGLQRAPAIGLVGAGAVSVQFGAALATKLFARTGPAGAVTLRLVLAAALLVVGTVVGRCLARPAARRQGNTGPLRGAGAGRPGLARRAWPDVAVAVGFGLVLAAMNLSFYEAIDRIPLGVAVTIEFVGPLGVALAGSRRVADGVWAAGAGAGVALLAAGAGHRLDLAGAGYALMAGAFWAGYILLSRETGRRFESLSGLALAMSVAALAVVPLGVADGGAALVQPYVLGLGAAVAVLSSVVPYSLELMALRRATARAFGVMMSLDPGLATAAGFVVLGQRLTGKEWAALGLVAGANLGNALTARSRRAAAVPVVTPD